MSVSIVKKSFRLGFEIFSGFSVFIGLLGYTVRDININFSFLTCLLLLTGAYILTAISTYFIYKAIICRPYKTKVKGNKVTIKVGDIFEQEGWKVIPFNEHFDTTVDDKIIAHSTLNGAFLDNHCDKEEVENTIRMYNARDGQKTYPLGTIIPYREYMLLAFSHFDENDNAYIDITEYESCLLKMWASIRKAYAGKPVVLPLIGSGITDIYGVAEKKNTDLLECLLCSLKNSRFHSQSSITIVLTHDAMESIDMNEIRSLY